LLIEFFKLYVGYVNDVYQTRKGDLWIGSENGLFEFIKTGKTKEIQMKNKIQK